MSKSYFWSIRAVGEDNHIILEKDLKYLPLREESIILKSIEFFDDPEPCMIHRSAVINRICMELLDFIKSSPEDNYQLNWDEIPEALRQHFDFKEKVRKLEIRRLPR